MTKEYIGYDDPILETVPIKKQRTESSRPVSAERETEVVVTTLGAGLKITRTALNTLETLAQKANQARTKQEKFETLASRASSSSVKSRLDGRGYSSEGELGAGRTSAGSVLSPAPPLPPRPGRGSGRSRSGGKSSPGLGRMSEIAVRLFGC